MLAAGSISCDNYDNILGITTTLDRPDRTIHREEGMEDLGSKVVIRRSNDRAYLKELVRLSNMGGRNLSITELEVFLRCQPGGLFVALLDGRPIGFTAAVKWSHDVASGGLSIVNEEYRGRGLGKALWRERSKYLSDIKHFGICSVAERVEPNAKLGFKTIRRKSIMRGKVSKASLEVPHVEEADLKVIQYEVSAFDDVLAYDDTIQSIMPRPEFLRKWFAKDKTNTFVARSRGDHVIGYGCIQPAPEGYRLAPLYADSDGIALLLLRSLLNSLPEDEPTILIYAMRGEGECLGNKLKLGMLMADIAVMFTGEGFTFSWDRVYGCTGGELSFV